MYRVRTQITHGSFTSVLLSQGQHVLESKLERFFTIWAWSWNLANLAEALDLAEDLGMLIHSCGSTFSPFYLGLPLHPLYRAILPAIDTFSSNLPDGLMTIVLTPECIAPSSAYREQHYPTALARHLMSLVTRTRNEASTVEPHPATSQDVSDPPTNGTRTPPSAEVNTSNGFLGIPSAAMDIRRWGWSGGFSLNRSPDSNPGSSTPAEPRGSPKSIADGPMAQCDQSALEDAMSTNSFGSVEKEETNESIAPSVNEGGIHENVELEGSLLPDVGTPRPSRAPSPTSPPLETAPTAQQPNGDSEMPLLGTASSSFQENGDNEILSNTYFTSTTVFIAPNDDPLVTGGRTAFILKVSRRLY